MPNPIVKLGHKVLELEFAYDFYQNFVGGVRYRNSFVSSLLDQNVNRSNYVDLGSGTSEIVEVFGENHNYIGLDYSSKYLDKAKKRIHNCSSFQVFNFDLAKSGWNEIVLNSSENKNPIDAIALGLLHHLDDASASVLLREVHKTLQGQGFLYTVDPIITNQSSRIAKWFASNDRGKFVRNEKELSKLFSTNDFEIDYEVKRKQFRIPLDSIQIRATPI